jgi:uncharacterized membrane protein YbhN (UPF0104 family)
VKPTRPRTLLTICVVCAAITWAVLHAVYSKLPPLSWTWVPALLIAAGAEAWIGRDLRARITGREGYKPAPPLFVARMVALAKASSQVAALLAGVSAGFVVYLLGSLGSPAERHDLLTSAVGFGSSLVLAGAALYLEYCCRVPKASRRDRERDDDEAAPHRPSPPHH